VSVLVRAADVTNPQVLRWMADYQSRIARRHGWRPGQPCQRADLCPALSLTGLFNGQTPRTLKEARALVRALPEGFSQSALAANRAAANMAFTVRDMPVPEQRRLFDDMRAQLDPPPPVEARLAGVLVEQADSGADLESARWWLMVAALAAVGLVIAAACGARGLVALVPVTLAAGWAWLAAWVLGVPLDPLSAALGAVVVAVAAQPALALQRRAVAGETPAALAFGRTEALAGAAAMSGFLALVVAGPRTLRDFGLAGAVGVLLGLACVSLLLPAAIAWWERIGPVRFPRTRAAAAAAVLRLRPSRRAR
jgi:predicted RND superfamily exporter protein